MSLIARHKGSLQAALAMIPGGISNTTRDGLGFGTSQAGAVIWNITTSQGELWNGTVWVSLQYGLLRAQDILVTPAGNLTSTDVQAALEELQTELNTQSALQNADYMAGAGAPEGGEGVNGNYYLDVTSGDVYGPKAGGVWPTPALDNVYDQLGLATGVSPASTGVTGAVGSATVAAREDHRHPRDADVTNLRTTQGTSSEDVNLGTFTGTTIANSSTVKAALQALETATEAGAAAHEHTHNATTSWTNESGDWVLTLLGSTHGKGSEPVYILQEGSSAPYKRVFPGQDGIINGSGDIELRVPSSPDERYAGKILVQ